MFLGNFLVPLSCFCCTKMAALIFACYHTHHVKFEIHPRGTNCKKFSEIRRIFRNIVTMSKPLQTPSFCSCFFLRMAWDSLTQSQSRNGTVEDPSSHFILFSNFYQWPRRQIWVRANFQPPDILQIPLKCSSTCLLFCGTKVTLFSQICFIYHNKQLPQQKMVIKRLCFNVLNFDS